MSVYGQEAELDLLASLLPLLDERTVVDVGAERGAVAARLVDAGAPHVHLFEPAPENASSLRERFAGDARVTIREAAVGDGSGTRVLRLCSDASGARVSYLHTVDARSPAGGFVWDDELEVEYLSLGELVAAGTLPRRVGMLKVDTEGHDLAVVRGMGDLDADVVIVEHWVELELLGPSPWRVDEMMSALGPRGFRHFACLVHAAPFAALTFDVAEIEPGEFANLVFLHDRVVDRALPALLEIATRLAGSTLRAAREYRAAADERLAVVEELNREARARLEIVNRLDADLRSALEHQPPAPEPRP
jgi:FkbM family methyltransferase